jgi:hypothetical protein
MITTVRRELCSLNRMEYTPFGNTRARNIFKDFWFGGNINDANEVTKVFVLSLITIAPFLKFVKTTQFVLTNTNLFLILFV